MTAAATSWRRPVARSGAWAVVVAFAGAASALLVTWIPVFDITLRKLPPVAAASVVEQSRREPSDTVLARLWSIAVGADAFATMSGGEIIAAADAALNGRFTLEGESFEIAVPFVPGPDLYRTDARQFSVCRFAVPNLLARAYAASGDHKYLDAAVDYVLAWSRFESGLVLPRGYVFNDHAASARAIVVAEVWRLYRRSAQFDAKRAAGLVTYAAALSRLLSVPQLFEYRTNHGFMQNLSLMHLAIAFPALQDAASSATTAMSRMSQQVPYFVSPEGVVLEHSAGYQHFGLECLTAAASYLELLRKPFPSDFRERYERALEFEAALRRPDGTLPPIGDTDDEAYPPLPSPHRVSDGLANESNATETAPERAPASLVAARSAYAITWTGLDGWPDAQRLSQTVLHWANFPSNAHKHADELGLSLWEGGTQWITAVGYWGYVPSRDAATGWRSSNAPHWVGEPPEVARVSVLRGRGTGRGLSFFDVSRSGPNVGTIRRQLLEVEGRYWIAVDAFDSSHSRAAEIVWRTTPSLQMDRSPGGAQISAAEGRKLAITVNGTPQWDVDVDSHGDAAWNSGVWSRGRAVPSAAVRVTSTGSPAALVTVLALQEGQAAPLLPSSVHLDLRSAEDWTVSISGGGKLAASVARERDRITFDASGVGTSSATIEIPTSDSLSAQQTLASFAAVKERYGAPFQPMLERRTKVSVVTMLTGALQAIVCWLVGRRAGRLFWPLTGASIAAWAFLCLFLRTQFLV